MLSLLAARRKKLPPRLLTRLLRLLPLPPLKLRLRLLKLRPLRLLTLRPRLLTPRLRLLTLRLRPPSSNRFFTDKKTGLRAGFCFWAAPSRGAGCHGPQARTACHARPSS
ncbi:conserved protein of unknown function [Cupriavidus neocaledonicus]|uniref:Uncharacterized protein n=1 Tax=Cupriavidus neocaledonicus TaxID=1040979 RepID=A0A375H5M1_9BURK|nr:conserved exported hypothetical protein [Cupriavidus neocaledonicus]SPD46176.1 conserved protein of unknown function [Cupriavidus neocaledonicus]